MFPSFHTDKLRNRIAVHYRLALQVLILGLAVNGCSAQNVPPDNQPQPQITDEVTNWPVVLVPTEGRVEVYQPQPQSMKGNTLTARAAVSLTRSETSAPVFGTVWFTAHVITDRDTRTVTLSEVTVSDVRISGSTPAEEQDFKSAIGGRLSNMAVTFPLDQLTSSLDTASASISSRSKLKRPRRTSCSARLRPLSSQ